MFDGSLLQTVRDCLGYALMDKYIPDWKNMTEDELYKIIDELKCNKSKVEKGR